MGKLNWRAGLAYASEGLRQGRERKREYERADEENAMTISRLLAEQGMPIPEPLMKSLSTKYPITSQLMPQLDKAIREGRQRKLEEEIMQTYQNEMIKSQFREPKKEPQKPSEVQMFEMFAGKTLDEVKQMPNDERRELFSAYAKSKRKEETAKTIKPRYQIIKNESTGKVTRINVDTGEETVVREEDPDTMKKNKAKEEAERIKQEKQDAKEANALYSKWVTGGRNPEDLANLNNALKVFGHQVTPIEEPGTFWGKNITGYNYGKIGETAAKDPSQMSDEELAAEVARINRGQ